ncbi:hypothetical protein BC829DRAFT_490610 [Chytridium lagenaria]|nr:hypothetical protein BC829DRAFT_490610 [Chytridium lagenaria]
MTQRTPHRQSSHSSLTETRTNSSTSSPIPVSNLTSQPSLSSLRGSTLDRPWTISQDTISVSPNQTMSSVSRSTASHQGSIDRTKTSRTISISRTPSAATLTDSPTKTSMERTKSSATLVSLTKRRGDADSVAAAFLEKHNATEPLPSTSFGRFKEKWKKVHPACKVCTWITIFSLLTSAIITPLMFKYFIPWMIQDGFAKGTGMSDRAFTVSRLALTNMMGVQDGTVAPTSLRTLNLPVSLLGPSTWTFSVGRAYASSDGTLVAPPENRSENMWYPIAVVDLTGDMDIRASNLSMDMRGAKLRVPRRPDPLSYPAYIDEEQSRGAFPLGRGVCEGVCKCIMNGIAGEVPRIRIEAKPDFKLGPFLFKGLQVARVFDIGRLMTDAEQEWGYTGRSGMTLAVGNLTSENRLFTASVTLNLENPSPFTLAFNNLTLRLNVTSTPIATLTIPRVFSKEGDTTITFTVLLRPVSSQSSENWVIGVDQVTLGGGGGGSEVDGRMQWVRELMDEIWLSVPMSLLGGETGLQLGVWVVRILETLVGGSS